MKIRVLAMIGLCVLSSGAAHADTLDPLSNHTQPTAISLQALLKWSQKAVVSAYTYTYLNRKDAESGMKAYFTPSGWSKFSAAVHASGNVDIVKQEEMHVSATLDGSPSIVGQDHSTGRSIFQVRVPVEVTYSGVHYVSRQAMNVDLFVAEQATHDGDAPDFKIEVFQAVTDVNRQHEKDLPSYCKWQQTP